MAEYYKKVIILKGVLKKISGSVKLIKEKGKIKAQIDFISKNANINGLIWCLSGDTHAVIGNCKDLYRYTLELDGNFSFLDGASFSICDLENEKLLCYGEYGIPCLKENAVIKYLKSIDLNDKEIKGDKSEYDDELIATENYYNRKYEELLLEQIDDAKNKHQKKASKEEIKKQPFSDEKGTCRIENYEYYRKIEEKLNSILKNHESVLSLNKLIDGGKFVKINYDKNNCYYVGKIEKDNKPKYICYGVKGNYGNCPDDFKSNSHFIPESEFTPEGLGYYFIFQSVHNGEIIV